MVSFLEKDNKFNSVSKREKPLFYKKKSATGIFLFFIWLLIIKNLWENIGHCYSGSSFMLTTASGKYSFSETLFGILILFLLDIILLFWRRGEENNIYLLLLHAFSFSCFSYSKVNTFFLTVFVMCWKTDYCCLVPSLLLKRSPNQQGFPSVSNTYSNKWDTA